MTIARASPYASIEHVLRALLATFGMAPAPVLADRLPPITCCNYIQVEQGHLALDGKRLRLWGVNIQSGVFGTHEEIDAVIQRLQKLGFNGIRLWPTTGTFRSMHRGLAKQREIDPERALDFFDRMVFRAGQNGMRVQMTMLHYLDLRTIRATYAAEFGTAKAALLDDSQLRLVHGILPYVSPTYAGVLKSHIASTLQHTNPYTERPYHSEPAISAWELANESRFVECLTQLQCRSRLPAEVAAAIEQSWQAWLTRDHAVFDRSTSIRPKIAEATPEAVTRFAVETFARVSADLETTARQAGGPNSGVAVQPFIYNTGPAQPHVAAHYANSLGSATAIGLYASPLNKAPGAKSPWLPWSESGTLPSYFTYLRIKDKPLVVYETSFFRPYDQRAEFGPVMAAVALEQDWDAVYLYQYGQPAVLYGSVHQKPMYGRYPLSNPDWTSADPSKASYTRSFHHGADPTTMASWSLAGRLFVAAQGNPRRSVTFQIPVTSVHQLAMNYPARLIEDAHQASRHAATSIQFTANRQVVRTDTSKSLPESDFSTEWSGSNRYLKISTPGGSLFSGIAPLVPVSIPGGLTFLADRPGFLVVGAATDFLGSHVHVITDTRNAGYQFDDLRVEYDKPYGAQFGIKAQGSAPLTYEPTSVRIRLPAARARAEESFDFNDSPVPGKAAEIDLHFSSEQFRTRLLDDNHQALPLSKTPHVPRSH